MGKAKKPATEKQPARATKKQVTKKPAKGKPAKTKPARKDITPAPERAPWEEVEDEDLDDWDDDELRDYLDEDDDMASFDELCNADVDDDDGFDDEDEAFPF